MRRILTIALLAFSLSSLASAARAEEPDEAEEKLLSGMSIVGNDEAPKSLVIVPWKSSELGPALEVSRALDDGRDPLDPEIFRRALDYHQIRSGWDAEGRPAQE